MIMIFCDNCGEELEETEVKYYTSQFGLDMKLCEKCLDNYIGKSERRELKLNQIVKTSTVLIIIFSPFPFQLIFLEDTYL
ncbi:hypothetical protein MBGDF03_00805 [Thermoplasmatales archaeon SCGC AB-540-F20]|nr:hypothetical protein MBGDF03_00805 [Thermoplasmatales archaeon SCGC AB-540-F20]